MSVGLTGPFDERSARCTVGTPATMWEWPPVCHLSMCASRSSLHVEGLKGACGTDSDKPGIPDPALKRDNGIRKTVPCMSKCVMIIGVKIHEG